MIRNLAPRWLLVVLVCVAVPAAASAQLAPALALPALAPLRTAADTAVIAQGELYGVVQDDGGTPLHGAVISALGSTTAFAVSDRAGRFVFRSLPYGSYLLRAHLQGYVPERGRVVQVNSGRSSWTLALSRVATESAPAILAAGIGAGTEMEAAAADTHDHDAVAWRLRHLKRSVLKDVDGAVSGTDDSFIESSVDRLARAVGGPARLASAMFAGAALNGQINLLTTTSFNRPQDLLSVDAALPHGVAYLALVAPTSTGQWTFHGTMTQGDISSWILAGSFVRRSDADHRYEAGLSYGMQRYYGGNGEALNAVRDGGRNVGTLYAYDDWKVSPRVRVAYGSKYAHYDYLADGGLLSPRASVTVQPLHRDPLRVRVSVHHREVAPGAEEFLPPTTGLWLPPERTFSPVGRAGFAAERMNRVELAAEREWAGNVVVGVRAFQERIDNQLVTLFGAATGSSSTLGHYAVGSGGDIEARGYGVTLSRQVNDRLRAAVDYSYADARRVGLSPSERRLASVAPSVLRGMETLHDVTASMQSVIPVTATRLLVMYRVNNRFSDALSAPSAGSRFDVQVNQSLPFLNFTHADWEMLIAVRNMYRADLLDGSVYDELLVVRPPTRILGGVTVRF